MALKTMIDDEPIPAPPFSESKDLDDDGLVAECLRLLDAMEARIDAFENAGPRKTETGADTFWPLRGLDEINFLGKTFQNHWTELRIRTPDPPGEIRKRAEDLVERFLVADTNIVVPGEPGQSTRQRLRHLLGLSAYD